ncbi:helix-turn-helix domain-containing protein [uncultured Roseivirga sp.]|uniref:helix-turn-helix domain-containing protein n=1 Tax=uncultured Roseivirga sp. TaxID=543088 RepID=UPI0030DBF2A2|tara:strand:- start:970 stop:1425 length:456 start_codon:yes stop_codon:yes gene_type:complete
MSRIEEVQKPSKEEQKTAMASYNALSAMLEQLDTENPEIEIEETQEKIRIPLLALKLLAKILKVTSQGKPFSIVPIATEMTTQAAAEVLGCSRPHLIKILDAGDLPFTKVGKHRRIKYEDVKAYRDQMKANQERLIVEIMKGDEELGLYDS